MMLQDKIMNESVKDSRERWKRIAVSVVPGTLPVTEGHSTGKGDRMEVAQNQVSRPYTIPSKHERRRSS